jgi:hypothetical protein
MAESGRPEDQSPALPLDETPQGHLDLAAKFTCDLWPRPLILRRMMKAMYGLGTR